MFDRKTVKEQDEIDILSNYAARLAEERRRVQPHQGIFAKSIGITQGRQSLLEQGKRELRADYLETVAAVGLDVRYIVTGERSPDVLPADVNELVSLYLGMEEDFREAVLIHTRSMYNALARQGLVPPPPPQTPPPAGGLQDRASVTGGATLHDRQQSFRK